jgi:hypothetical protein
MMTFEDGILEIGAGFMATFAALMMLEDSAALVGLGAPIAYVMVLSAKRAVTEPRLAMMPPGPAPARRQMMVLSLTGLLVLGLIVLFLFIETGPSGQTGSVFVGTMLGLAAAAIIAAGVLWSTPRVVGYGSFLGAVLIVSRFIDLDFPWWLAAFGLAVVIGGAVQLYRFMRTYPIREHTPVG